MTLPRPLSLALGLSLALALTHVSGIGSPAESQAPKKGGVLQTLLIEDPPGLLAHESATVSNVWPMSPCYSNLVLFHPLKPLESVDTVIPELAERWSWQDNYRNLVFFLRKNVKWHDGKPLTSRDVKYTFDVAREAPEPHTVVFRLKRPQPSLLLMLASGYSPIYPAHVPLGELRQKCMGTGPFRFKEWLRGQSVELERNPGYFIPDRPYLDGIRYTVITERGTRLAALQAGRLDAFVPLEMTRAMADAAKKSAPTLVITEVGQNGSDNVVINLKRPPFDNLAVRRGGAVVGAGLMPKPLGIWGLSDPDLKTLPGYRNSATDKAEARRLLAAAGFGPGGKPLRVELATRTLSIYLDVASFVADQLHQVGIEATVKQMDSAAWFPALARRDFQIGANLTAGGFDDPDAYFVENYKCGSSRNYTDYCSEETDRLIELLEADVARPMLGWRKEYFAHYPHVKNLVPHNALYNYGRMQDVWLDR